MQSTRSPGPVLRRSLREIRARPRDRVVLIGYRICDAELSVVVPSAKLTALDGSRLFSRAGEVSFLILREFIRSEFTKPVATGTELLYRVTEALCRIWLDAPHLHGWTYPSVESPQQTCFALKKTFVDSPCCAVTSAELIDVLGEQDRCFAIRSISEASISIPDVSWHQVDDRRPVRVRWVAPRHHRGALVWPV